MRFKKKLLLLAFSLVWICTKAQDSLAIDGIEIRTYQLYAEKKWPELIALINKAFVNEIDYYYLRMRIGIAHFEKGNYNKAEVHFKKAIEFNSNDELAKTYLYYCLINNGRDDEARSLSRKFSDSLNIATGEQKERFMVLIEGGSKLSNQNLYSDPLTKSEVDYFNPALYFQIGLKHSFKKRVTLFHAYTHYNQITYIGKVNQNQYYLSANLVLNKSFVLIPAFHFTQINFIGKNYVIDFNTGQLKAVKDTIYPKINSNVLSLAIKKQVKQLNLSIGATFITTSTLRQYIYSTLASYAVFGNPKLIIGSQFYLHSISTNSVLYGSVAPFVYYQAIPKFSMKLSYLYNQGNNLVEDNGYLINNSLDLTNSRWSLLCNYDINTKVSVYGLYQYENKTEIFNSFKYHYNVFLGGIKIKF